jgi:hypothetical protein
VYILQKVQRFHEQPSVTGRISDSASLGGRITGSTQRIRKPSGIYHVPDWAGDTMQTQFWMPCGGVQHSVQHSAILPA